MIFHHRVSIERGTPSTSTTGEMSLPASPWPTVATNVPASIQPRSGSFRQREFGQPMQSTHRAFFDKGTDIRTGDRVLHGSTRYLVTFVADQFGHHFEVDLSQVVAP